jgi:DNA (cytosine-5)-methyltransferase 1
VASDAVAKIGGVSQVNLASPSPPARSLRVAGLFAGIGGIEQGLKNAGHRTELLCENDEAAAAVLGHHFEAPLAHDVRELEGVGDVDLVAAGFPCQDLSQAGRTAGITGGRSGLVQEVFRLMNDSSAEWLLLENVPFMLQLERGEAMRYLAAELSAQGFTWAYRVVDSRAFGLPQRRRRVLLLASRTSDPRPVLFAGDAGEPEAPPYEGRACGFYWTEGVRGLGWAVDAIPTLKGGSSVGIPSPPAIWLPGGEFVLPDIRDAERLQGFAANWTAPAVDDPSRRNGPRWRLVGNAVSVPVSEWLGHRLAAPPQWDAEAAEQLELDPTSSWPKAAWGDPDGAQALGVSAWPQRPQEDLDLGGFLRYPTRPLSERAARGFLSRAERSSLRFPPGFLEALRTHLDGYGAKLAA